MRESRVASTHIQETVGELFLNKYGICYFRKTFKILMNTEPSCGFVNLPHVFLMSSFELHMVCVGRQRQLLPLGEQGSLRSQISVGRMSVEVDSRQQPGANGTACACDASLLLFLFPS